MRGRHPAAPARRGVSLFLALVVVATLSLMAAVALRISSDESDIALRDVDSVQALVAAETGIGHAASALALNPRFVGELSGTVEVESDPAVTDTEERCALYVARVLDESGDGTPDAVVASGAWRGQRRTLAVGLTPSVPPALDGRPREIGP